MLGVNLDKKVLHSLQTGHLSRVKFWNQLNCCGSEYCGIFRNQAIFGINVNHFINFYLFFDLMKWIRP